MSDYNLTLFEACELLNRSKKSISRYVRRGLLHPEQIKSQQGTLEYRFSRSDLEAFKGQEKPDQTRQDRGDKTGQDRTEETPIKDPIVKEIVEQTRQDTPEETRQDRTGETGHEIIKLLKETTGLLKEQLATKDEQIKDLSGKIDQLIERDRETNILLKGLQEKVLVLEKPKQEETGHEETKKIEEEKILGEDTKKSFWQRIFD